MFSNVPDKWLIAVAVSEGYSLWLLVKLWLSDDHLFFKIVLSVLGLVPLFGPLIILWVCNFPPVQPPAIRDQWGWGTDVFERWRSVFEEKNTGRRFYRWRAIMDDKRDDH